MTDRARRITKNSLWVLISRIVEIVTGLLALALVARYLGVADFGMYSLTMAVVWTISPFLILGLPRILMRDIAQDNQRATDLIRVAVQIVVFLGAPIFILGFIVALFAFPQSKTALAIAISFAGIVFVVLKRILVALFSAHEKMNYETFFTLVNACAYFLLTWLCIKADLGFISLFIAFSLANVSDLAIAFFLARPLVSFRDFFSLDREQLSYIIRESLPLVFSHALFQGQQYLGVFMLGFLCTAADVGIFQAPFRVFARLQLFPAIIMMALAPLLSQLSAGGVARDELRRVLQTAHKFVLIAGLPLAIIGYFLADDVVVAMFGSKFAASASVLQVLMPALPVSFMMVFFDNILTTLRKQRYAVMSTAAGLAALFIASLVLVPLQRADGAAMASLIAFYITAALMALSMNDVVSLASFARDAIRPVFAAVVMGALTYFFHRDHVIIVLIAASAAYIILLFSFKTFSAAEIRFVRAALKGGKAEKNTVRG